MSFCLLVSVWHIQACRWHCDWLAASHFTVFLLANSLFRERSRAGGWKREEKRVPLWREAVPDWGGESGQHLSGGSEAVRRRGPQAGLSMWAWWHAGEPAQAGHGVGWLTGILRAQGATKYSRRKATARCSWFRPAARRAPPEGSSLAEMFAS